MLGCRERAASPSEAAGPNPAVAAGVVAAGAAPAQGALGGVRHCFSKKMEIRIRKVSLNPPSQRLVCP